MACFLYRCGACHFFHCQKTDNAGRKSADSDTGVQHLFNSILNNGRQVLESPLVLEDGNYRVDFEDLEQKLADPQTTLFMILCNPHNPGGKIWDRATLSRIGELCQKISCDCCVR